MRKKIYVFFALLPCILFCAGILPAEEPKKEASSEKKSVVVLKDVSEANKLSFENFLGPDTSINATGRIGDGSNYVKVGVEKRKLLGGTFFVGADTKGRIWEDKEFDLLSAGVDIYAGKYINDNTRLRLRYRLDNTDVSHAGADSYIDFSRQEGSHNTTAISLELARSTLDDSYYPKSGSIVLLFGECALKSLGGDYDFSLYQADAAGFFTPFWDITIGGHVAAGLMQNFGSSEDVPFFERFFVGSASTVRGFRWGRDGPRSPDRGTPVGGDFMTIGNLEARLPIYKKLKGAVFFDVGRGYENKRDFGHMDVQETAGIGLRYLTPFIVSRVDYGFILNRKNGEDTGYLHVTLGLPF